MFHTIRYKGHHIHVAYLNGVEKIETQITHADGGFDLQRCKTYAGAQRAITKYVRATASQ
jgi:hypothetical protein